VLESALVEFPGTIVFISHDRYFINRIATAVVEVVRGVLTAYPGSYDDFLDAKARGVEPAIARPSASRGGRAEARVKRDESSSRGAGQPPALGAARAAEATPATGRPAVRLVKKRPSAEVKELRRRVEEVERRIHELEARMAEIGAALSNPRIYLDGDRVRTVSSERKVAEEQMAGLLREWEDLSTALSAHE
jgi:ATP-binding cassette subfamily F protein 3